MFSPFQASIFDYVNFIDVIMCKYELCDQGNFEDGRPCDFMMNEPGV